LLTSYEVSHTARSFPLNCVPDERVYGAKRSSNFEYAENGASSNASNSVTVHPQQTAAASAPATAHRAAFGRRLFPIPSSSSTTGSEAERLERERAGEAEGRGKVGDDVMTTRGVMKMLRGDGASNARSRGREFDPRPWLRLRTYDSGQVVHTRVP